MKHLASLLLAPVLSVLAFPATAQSPADEAAQVAQAIERGRLIFAYDRAAWQGTDDLLAKMPDARDRLAGYIVDGPADSPRLVFFDKAATPRPVYVARFRRGRLIEGGRAANDLVLTEAELRLIAARKAAVAAIAGDTRPCADKPFNTVVLPPAAPGGPIGVYLLTPQTTSDTLPLGGHFRIDVDSDGRAGAVRRFARSCLAVPTVPARGDAVGFVATHLLDPTRTEIHVFSSLALSKPIYVATMQPTQRLWVVDGTRIAAPRPSPRK